MKILEKFASHYLQLFLIFVSIVFFVSCEKENDVPEITDHHLVSYEKVAETQSSVLISTMYIFSYQYPELSLIAAQCQYDVSLYKIIYRTPFLDDSINASGLVILPVSTEAMPLISFQNGTNTLKSSAPSVAYDNPTYTLISGFASTGYIICIPDYIGFGESSQFLHPYHDRTSSDNAVIDMIKATTELLLKEDIQAKSNNNLFLMGYSQGGWATLSAFDRIENNHDPDMNIIAVSCGAGAYNLMQMSNYVFDQFTYPSPHYLPYFIESHRQLGALSDSLSLFFKHPYCDIIPGLFDGTKTQAEINSELNDTIAALCTENLIFNFNTGTEFSNLRDELEANSISGWNTNTPLNFYHSTGDKSVPSAESDSIVASFINSGSSSSNIHLILVDSLDHSDAAIPWGIQTIQWFLDMKK